VNLLAIIIILLAIAAAGGIIYAAWELSSDKPRGARPKETGADEPRDV
jgi:flagellar basal body-associated protein FliL